MTQEQLKEFFEINIANYAPYKDKKIYKSLLDFLFNYYFEHSYTVINDDYKKAFEEQVIPKNFYNPILLSNGFTEDLLNKLTERDKYILLNTFIDFNKSKGSLQQVTKVCDSFGERLNLYELFLDSRVETIKNNSFTFEKDKDFAICSDEIVFNTLALNDYLYPDNTNDSPLKVIKKDVEDDLFKVYFDKPYTKENANPNPNISFLEKWVFVPKPVYVHPELKNNIITDPLDFASVYPIAKYFFIHKGQLNDLKDNRNLILPIKTNLLLMDFNKYRESNSFFNMISSIVLREYRNNRLNIYFKDAVYSTSLEKLCQFWYYVLFETFGMDIETFNMFNPMVLFYIDKPNFPYKITDIDGLLDEYNNLKFIDEVSNFCYNKIESKFKDYYPLKFEIQHSNLKNYFRNILNKDLLDYFDNRINSSIDKNQELIFILDELYNSIISWTIIVNDELVNKHFHFLLNVLPQVSFTVNKSSTYHILQFFKPHHVELLTQFSERIRIKDKFNSEILNDKKRLIVKLLNVNLLNIADTILFNINFTNNDSLNISSHYQFKIKEISKQLIELNDNFRSLFKFFLISDKFVIDSVKIKNIIDFMNFVVINNEFLLNVLHKNHLSLNVLDQLVLNIKMYLESLICLIDNYNILNIINKKDNVVINNEFLLNVLHKNHLSLNVLDQLVLNIKMYLESLICLIDNYNILNIINKKDNVVINNENRFLSKYYEKELLYILNTMKIYVTTCLESIINLESKIVFNNILSKSTNVLLNEMFTINII